MYSRGKLFIFCNGNFREFFGWRGDFSGCQKFQTSQSQNDRQRSLYCHHSVSHCLTEGCRQQVIFDLSQTFFLHCSLSAVNTFSWIYLRPVHCSMSFNHERLGCPWWRAPYILTVSDICPVLIVSFNHERLCCPWWRASYILTVSDIWPVLILSFNHERLGCPWWRAPYILTVSDIWPVLILSFNHERPDVCKFSCFLLCYSYACFDFFSTVSCCCLVWSFVVDQVGFLHML